MNIMRLSVPVINHHQTTCQICARPILSKLGLIAHHGYRRPGGGWQTASCIGARHLPYEVSCDALPPAIKIIESWLNECKENLKTFLANPPSVLVEISTWSNKKWEWTRPENFNQNDPSYRSSMPHTYECEYSHRKHAYENNIRTATSELAFLNDRLAKWHEKHPEGVPAPVKKVLSSIDQRADRAYQRSAYWLCKANELAEKGKKAQAEKCYEMSSRHLMRYNDLVEKHGAKEV